MWKPIAIPLFVLSAAAAAAPQSAGVCAGGRLVTGFQFTAEATPADEPLPLDHLNDLGPGETLRYAPNGLPTAWKGPARVAALLVPKSANASAGQNLNSQPADKTVEWKVTAQMSAVAFLFGPEGMNAQKSGSLLEAHPEMVAKFEAYAEQASRVEALIELFARYEQSPPGSLNLDAMLKTYASEYGISAPRVNPALSPDQQAAELLTAIAPPTAGLDPSPHAALTSSSTNTATALASLYFGPEVGIASDTLPVFNALHQTLFPGVQIQGAFAQSSGDGMYLCTANSAAPAQKHPVYLWMVDLPGGTPPALRLAKGASVDLPADAKASMQVTGASVAQLHELPRARQWKLTAEGGAAPVPVPVPVEVEVSDLNDTLALDLTKVKPGAYHLAALWDWTPVTMEGTVNVQAVPSLAAAKPAPGAQNGLVPDNGTVGVALTGADFSQVTKAALIAAAAPAGDAGQTLSFEAPGGETRNALTVKVNTAKLAPGGYEIRLTAANGSIRDIPVTVRTANPALEKLPLKANLGESGEAVMLHGAHLELINRISSPSATWTLAAAASGAADLKQREAKVTLAADAKVGEVLPVDLHVTGLSDPLQVEGGLEVEAPRPVISNVTAALAAGIAVELRPGELPGGSIANFTFALDHAPAPAVMLRCAGHDGGGVVLHPGGPAGDQDLESGGDGLYYLGILPGKLGGPGCRLQIVVTDAGGDSNPYDLGRIVGLPHIDKFTLSNQSAGANLFSGTLTGDNLQLIARTGWNADTGAAVAGIPQRTSDGASTQTLAINMPWPPPSPHAPLYIWLRGETQGRKTTVAMP